MLNIIKYPDKPIYPLEWYNINFSHNDEILREIIETGELKTIVEVGTFVGWTACLIAKMPCVEKVYTVDKWQKHIRECRDPEGQFLSNIVHKNLQDKIIPIKGDSGKVGKQFQKLKIKPDLVYIDAHHGYDSVMKDIKSWYPVTKIICGDDYNYKFVRRRGLVRAVNELAKKYKRKVKNISNFWWYETTGINL